MPDIVSLRYFPTDVPFRDPADPGLAAPPEGRPYEIVALQSDGYTTHQLVHPDRLRTTSREPDAAAVAQSFADGREALYCRQARAWFVGVGWCGLSRTRCYLAAAATPCASPALPRPDAAGDGRTGCAISPNDVQHV